LTQEGKQTYHRRMRLTKAQAISIWGNQRRTALALGIARQSIYSWPDLLPQWQTDRVIGAALRTGRVDKLVALGLRDQLIELWASHNPQLSAA